MKQFVAYYRVSTQRQGISGLGLEAQQASVAAYVAGKGQIANSFTEVESGKKNDRVQLAEAVASTKRLGATLIIAKLDRLSRSASFIFTLRDAGVDFQCCDIPDMNTLTVGLFAVMAQHEREVISRRVTESLAAKRARGEQLGNLTNLTQEGRSKGGRARAENARVHLANVQAKQLIHLLQGQPQKPSLRVIASTLNASGYRTRMGCNFTATQVLRLSG
jgi:DNA invertase Pin-like site-specific DNA recombinase